MGVLSKVFKNKDAPKPQSTSLASSQAPIAKTPAKWEDAWIRKQVTPEEVQPLLHACTLVIKSRALEMPFLILPFRPTSDTMAARNFVRNYFKTSSEFPLQYQGQDLEKELKLTEPLVLCSIIKWCWSRLKGGVVTWNTYELFRIGEKDSNTAKHAFDTFIPLCAASEAHQKIIFDFFDLLAAIAANGKTNGLGGRKLSRFAGWWAFDHSENAKGFTAGYKSWASAADAASHLFFAYLRSLSPDGKPGTSGYSKLPRSLQALLAQTDYPPNTPELLLSRASKVVMMVNKVSPTPYALLRRVKNFDYRDEDQTLQRFSEYGDPVNALTPECRRVLEAIAATNTTTTTTQSIEKTLSSNRTDASWSRFEDLGFSSLLEEPNSNDPKSPTLAESSPSSGAQYQSTFSANGRIGRPPTPSWADFLSTGFSDDASSRGPSSLLLPPDQILPPIGPARVQSSQSHVNSKSGLREDNLEPGELAGVSHFDVDETFWWVWMTSLAVEEPPERKAFFGRCALLETEMTPGRWLVIEEQLKTNTAIPEEALFVAEKKGRFSSFTTRRKTRRASVGRRVVPMSYRQTAGSSAGSKTTLPPEQQARVEAAAAALVQQQQQQEESAKLGVRRARTDENADAKTTSVMTLGLQPVIMKEAGPAMQWARKFDKETIRQKYLGDNMAGKGQFRDASPSTSMLNLETSLSAGEATALAQKQQNEVKPDLLVPESREIRAEPQAGPFIDPVQASTPTKPVTSSMPAPAMPTPATTVERTLPLQGTLAGSSPSETVTPVPVAQFSRNILVDNPAPAVRPQTPVQAEAAPIATEDEDTLVTNTPVRRVERKPVGSVDSTSRTHPALRKAPAPAPAPAPATEKPKQTGTTANVSNAAAIAAYRAAASPPASPEAAKKSSTLSAQKSQKNSNRGLKGLFGGKKKTPTAATSSTAVPEGPRPMNGSTLAAEQPKLARTPSFIRRKAAAETQESTAVVPQPEPTVHPTALVQPDQPLGVAGYDPAIDIDGGEPGPVVTTDAEDFTEPPPTTTAPAMIHPQENNSSTQFSNFSQGPEDDSPTPRTENEDIPTVHEASPVRQFNTRAAQLLVSNSQEGSPLQSHPVDQGLPVPEYTAPVPAEPENEVKETQFFSTDDESSIQESSAPVPAPVSAPAPVPAVGKDIVHEPQPDLSAVERWAQIRQNAANRKMSEEQESTRLPTTRQSQSAETEKTDDGETSGEETIESRVARIKARVAELTGGQTIAQPASQ